MDSKKSSSESPTTKSHVSLVLVKSFELETREDALKNRASHLRVYMCQGAIAGFLDEINNVSTSEERTKIIESNAGDDKICRFVKSIQLTKLFEDLRSKHDSRKSCIQTAREDIEGQLQEKIQYREDIIGVELEELRSVLDQLSVLVDGKLNDLDLEQRGLCDKYPYAASEKLKRKRVSVLRRLAFTDIWSEKQVTYESRTQCEDSENLHSEVRNELTATIAKMEEATFDRIGSPSIEGSLAWEIERLKSRVRRLVDLDELKSCIEDWTLDTGFLDKLIDSDKLHVVAKKRVLKRQTKVTDFTHYLKLVRAPNGWKSKESRRCESIVNSGRKILVDQYFEKPWEPLADSDARKLSKKYQECRVPQHYVNLFRKKQGHPTERLRLYHFLSSFGIFNDFIGEVCVDGGCEIE